MSASTYPIDEISAVDIFCGAGGFTTGIKRADIRVKVKKAINHWPVAIATHAKNHPEVEHLCTDVDDTDPQTIGHSTVLVASPSCQNHSLAKGAKRKKLKQLNLPYDGKEPELPPEAEERSRCLMEDPLRFVAKNKNLFFIGENVPDVYHWSRYQAWVKEWDALGYNHQTLYLNSMFFGVPQSRDRWYFVAWRKGIPAPKLNFHPLAYCQKCGEVVPAVQAWKKKNAVPWGRYGAHGQYWYRCPRCTQIVVPYYPAAANIINWNLPAQKIGERTRPLAPKTMERVRYGVNKFGRHPFTTQLNKTTPRAWDMLDGVFPTQTCDNSQYLVHQDVPYVLSSRRSGPALLSAGFTLELTHSDERVRGLSQPMQTLTRYDTTAFVGLPFILDHVGEYRPRSLMDPMSTQVAGGEHHSLVMPPFMVEMHGTSNARPATDALGTVLAGGNHHALVSPSPEQVQAWLMTYYQNGSVLPVSHSAPTITTRDRCALITSEQGACSLDINELRFRMLAIEEIQRAMDFEDGYLLTGTREEQVKQLGNAVTPSVVSWIFQRCLAALGC